MNTKLFLAVAVLVTACTPKDKVEAASNASDFDLFCSQFTEFTQSENYAELTAQERAARLDALLLEKLPATSNAYQAWAAIQNATPAQRPALYKDAAKSTGMKSWDCPAVERHGHLIGSY